MDANANELLPVRHALRVVAEVLDHGRLKYPDDGGFRQPASFHVNRAIAHLVALMAGNTTEEHLAHSCCRLLMAIEATYNESNTQWKMI
jgi:hypothetical protein